MDQQSATAADAGRDLHGPDRIEVRGARVHNLKNIDASIPLNRLVGIAGVSGSGKSSLALGVLYAEGSRRYLDALSTYTRRRMTQAAKAQVDEVLYVPAALALHQRPGVPGIRSTFGTGTELLNSLRLMFSRLAAHRCPNGHRLAPTLAVAAGQQLVCPVCGVHFFPPSAEELAFNSQGACRTCSGTGVVRTVDRASLVPDESLTIDEGAVAPWNTLMWSLMTDVCREMGVRTNVPFRDLTAREKDIVYNGPAVKKHIFYKAKNSNQAAELDFTYFNAVYTVENALAKVKDEKGMKRVERFLKEDVCPACGGTRLSDAARAPLLRGTSLAEACDMPLTRLCQWVEGVPASLPAEMRPMAHSICESFQRAARRLEELGLGYLALSRAAATLSTGERQRMQLARAVRNRTTGVLYVLDEPSIGLHPSNLEGLAGVMRDLVADGNSVLLVDHDTQVLSQADWLIEMGPQAGAGGGHVVAQGTPGALEKKPASLIGPFLSGKRHITARPRASAKNLFQAGRLRLSTSAIHTVKPLCVDIPKGRLTVVTGVSGSGKTTLVLESLVPALQAAAAGAKLRQLFGGEAHGAAGAARRRVDEGKAPQRDVQKNLHTAVHAERAYAARRVPHQGMYLFGRHHFRLYAELCLEPGVIHFCVAGCNDEHGPLRREKGQCFGNVRLFTAQRLRCQRYGGAGHTELVHAPGKAAPAQVIFYSLNGQFPRPLPKPQGSSGLLPQRALFIQIPYKQRNSKHRCKRPYLCQQDAEHTALVHGGADIGHGMQADRHGQEGLGQAPCHSHPHQDGEHDVQRDGGNALQPGHKKRPGRYPARQLRRNSGCNVAAKHGLQRAGAGCRQHDSIRKAGGAGQQDSLYAAMADAIGNTRGKRGIFPAEEVQAYITRRLLKQCPAL